MDRFREEPQNTRQAEKVCLDVNRPGHTAERKQERSDLSVSEFQRRKTQRKTKVHANQVKANWVITLGTKVLLAACLAPAALADVIDVRGPNPDATQISQAIAMASDGDVIRVYPGSYTGFTINGESLTLVSSSPTSRPQITGAVAISNLGPDQAVEMSGFMVRTTTPVKCFRLTSNIGAVRMSNVSATLSNILSRTPVVAAEILNCDDVVLTNCTVVGAPGVWALLLPSGGGDGGHGGDALTVSNSRLAMVRSTITGGTGGDAHYCCFMGQSGGTAGHGLSFAGSGSLYLSDCILIGGDGGWDEFVINFGRGAPGAGLYSTASSSAVQAGNCAINRIFPTQPIVLTVHQPRLSGPELQYDNVPIPITVHGSPGEQVSLRIGVSYGHRVLPGMAPLLITEATSALVDSWLPIAAGGHFLGTIGASGRLDVNLPAMALPMLEHDVLKIVALVRDASGIRVTNSVSTAILDTAW